MHPIDINYKPVQGTFSPAKLYTHGISSVSASQFYKLSTGRFNAVTCFNKNTIPTDIYNGTATLLYVAMYKKLYITCTINIYCI